LKIVEGLFGCGFMSYGLRVCLMVMLNAGRQGYCLSQKNLKCKAFSPPRLTLFIKRLTAFSAKNLLGKKNF
jgi:hypothetical protein